MWACSCACVRACVCVCSCARHMALQTHRRTHTQRHVHVCMLVTTVQGFPRACNLSLCAHAVVQRPHERFETRVSRAASHPHSTLPLQRLSLFLREHAPAVATCHQHGFRVMTAKTHRRLPACARVAAPPLSRAQAKRRRPQQQRHRANTGGRCPTHHKDWRETPYTYPLEES